MTFTGSQKVPNIEEMRGVFMILTMKLLKFEVFSKKHDFFHNIRKTGPKTVSKNVKSEDQK